MCFIIIIIAWFTYRKFSILLKEINSTVEHCLMATNLSDFTKIKIFDLLFGEVSNRNYLNFVMKNS